MKPADLTEFLSLRSCDFMISFMKYRMKALRKLINTEGQNPVIATTIIFVALFTLPAPVSCQPVLLSAVLAA